MENNAELTTAHYKANVYNHHGMMEIYLKGPMLSYGPWETRWVIPHEYLEEFAPIADLLGTMLNKQLNMLKRDDKS